MNETWICSHCHQPQTGIQDDLDTGSGNAYCFDCVEKHYRGLLNLFKNKKNQKEAKND